MKRVVDGPVPDEEGKAYPLALDVFKTEPAKMNLERVSVLDFIGFGKYLDSEQFGILPGKGRDFRINIKEIIRLTALDVFNLQKCSWGHYRGWN